MKEQVLVVEEGTMEGLNLPGVTTDQRDMVHFGTKMLTNAFYVDREEAEKNPNWKQIIPYVVFRTEGGSILVYRRTKKGGENRLHEKLSIGIGGHINPIDGDDPTQALLKAFSREVDEELQYDTLPNEDELDVCISGLIYDPSNEVGKVHLGVLIEVTQLGEGVAYPTPKEDSLGDFEFVYLHELKQNPPENLENWSKMVLEVL